LKEKLPSVDNAVEMELASASGEQLEIFQSAMQMFRYIASICIGQSLPHHLAQPVFDFTV